MRSAVKSSCADGRSPPIELEAGLGTTICGRGLIVNIMRREILTVTRTRIASQCNQSINFRLYKTENDIAAFLFRYLRTRVQYKLYNSVKSKVVNIWFYVLY